ncbi:hypothetical protein [Micromonospora humida]|uniref:Uncharacterized protein n=1 Tax=Micromonospora humida TaxID=2809018 RepID=A0ABS2J3J4_9ACTN|nr:hypothetical protein [Micromonospora humida]MBM7080665.1 hypothetical protein [Micromonospora humida]
MGRRWKWFLRSGTVAVDLTGQVVPDGNGPGRWRRRTVEGVVPDGVVTSRCDGALGHARRAGETPNQRADRYRVRVPRQRRAGSDG